MITPSAYNVQGVFLYVPKENHAGLLLCLFWDGTDCGVCLGKLAALQRRRTGADLFGFAAAEAALIRWQMIVYLTIILSVLFLLLQEKNQKKQAKGALTARSSRTGAAPFGNPRRASPQALEHLNENLFRQKIGTFFS